MRLSVCFCCLTSNFSFKCIYIRTFKDIKDIQCRCPLSEIFYEMFYVMTYTHYTHQFSLHWISKTGQCLILLCIYQSFSV